VVPSECLTLGAVGPVTELIERLDSNDQRKGAQFEHICKWFLTNDPVYRQQLRRVWLWKEWPGRWGADAGIDLVAEEHGGRLWAIQAKAYDPAYSVTKANVDTFLSESARPEFAFRLLIATTDQIGKTAERTLQAQEKPASRLLLADLRAAQVSWPRSPSDLRPAKPRPKRPRPHQRQAITAVIRGFESADRGQMIMACGTGKTLTALFIAQRLPAKRTLVLVPSLSLLTDTLREWTANDEDFEFLPVCSDETVTDTDAAVSSTTDLGFPVTTDPRDIATFLRRRSDSRRVVFATYQSSPKIAEAYRLGRVPGFDLVIADEAHRCAGRVSSDFAIVLDTDAIPARKRLFMTATPRFFTGRVMQEAEQADFEVASMDDESRFGPVFHRLGFAEAIERELLTDYQVVVVGVDDAIYLDWAQRGRFVTINGTKVTDARTLAGQIGLAKAMRRYDLRRTISFHSRVSAARQFANSMPELIDWMPARQRPNGQLWSHYASGEMSAGDRSALLDHLRYLDSDERGLLANARCLGEGIDVPALDGVAFIDPRRSEVDIVQAVGRAIRLAEDKTVGTIVIPVFIEASDDPEAALDASAFKPVWDVVRALRAHDDQLGEELDELRRQLGRGTSTIRLPSKLRLDLPARVNPDFASAFDVRLVEATTRNWEFSLGVLESYVEREATSNVPQSWTENGYRLGQWVAAIRQRYATGKFKDPVRIADLEHLPGWSWTPRDDRWERGYSSLCDFVDREGHSQVPRGHVENGFALGHWVTKQRHALRQLPDDERHQRLAGLAGWTWEPYDDRWENAYRLLKVFGDAEGHCDVPQSYSIDGVRLGAWVGQQRLQHRQGRLSQARSERLEALPDWTWNAVDDRWEKGYRLLEGFVRQHGHARVPVECRVQDYALGYWARTQRAFYAKGRLSPSRTSRLEALPGWSWDPFADQWEQGFSALLRYTSREGTSRVKRGQVEDGYQLGNWVGNQRAFYRKGKLSPEQVSRLEALPDWA
jgi:superfamily II DNA or RNA helicase